MIRRTPLVALVALAVTAGACGSAADESVDVTAAPVQTVAGVGVVPDTVPSGRQQRVLVPAPVNADGSPADLIGEVAPGNRVLIIGDSIIASTSSRYGGQMCDELVPLGWQVAVEAEPSRFVEFGNQVLDRVLDDDPTPETDWHAAVVFLGSNYNGDEVRYEEELRRILDRLAPRPTLLLTVTEYRSSYVEVNEVVRRLGAEYDNVTVIDWKEIAETPGVLSGDRLHPTETGREVLADAVAAALGPIGIGEGECLRSAFRDDSAINSGSGGGSSVGRSTSSSGRRTTTVRPTVTTTTAGGGSGGSGSVTATTVGSGGGTGTPTTQPPVTTPSASTQPATPQPATTQPATTQPPPPQPATTLPPTQPPPPPPTQPPPTPAPPSGGLTDQPTDGSTDQPTDG